jgi:signal recognition particle GTPase
LTLSSRAESRSTTELLDELEEMLISTDIGVKTTMQVLEAVRAGRFAAGDQRYWRPQDRYEK